MSQHPSVWLTTAERPTYPPLDGDLEVDVVVDTDGSVLDGPAVRPLDVIEVDVEVT